MTKEIIIIAHRGYWKDKSEQNTNTAFRRSFLNGFGVETDVRDYNGMLVISHDIANGDSVSLNDFFSDYNKYGAGLPLALNVKSDGLQVELMRLIRKHNIENYFVFDMSVPDMLPYLNSDMKVLVRRSEYEYESKLLDGVCGIWLDQFRSTWYDRKTIEDIMGKFRFICAVSPELHGREDDACWPLLKSLLDLEGRIAICTDNPLQARGYFNE